MCNRYCIYSKGEFIFEKNIYFEEHQLIIFQGKHFNYFIVVGGWHHVFWSDTHYSISLRYTRNIVQLNSFYIKFDLKHFFFIYIINTITNWRVSSLMFTFQTGSLHMCWQRNGAKNSESEIKMVISLVKLSFLFNSEITVFHRYLYNKLFYMFVCGVLFIASQEKLTRTCILRFVKRYTL
jgi:hypothetical protein